jgi:hypothetical protein
VGFLSKLLGVSEQKEALIRRLLKRRIANDPAAAAHGQTADFADTMPTLIIVGMAEATIVTCVESWGQLRGQGMSDADIARKIASFRGGASGTTVEAVIRSRVQSEHGHSGYLPPDHIDWCIKEAKAAYGIG